MPRRRDPNARSYVKFADVREELIRLVATGNDPADAATALRISERNLRRHVSMDAELRAAIGARGPRPPLGEKRCTRCYEPGPTVPDHGWRVCDDCKRADLQKRRPRPEGHAKWCEVCGEPFRARDLRAKRCSRRCFNIAQGLKKIERRGHRPQWQIWKAIRELVWQRDGGRCHICGDLAAYHDWHCDHVIPKCHGGTDDLDNLAVSHPACNLAKGATERRLTISE